MMTDQNTPALPGLPLAPIVSLPQLPPLQYYYDMERRNPRRVGVWLVDLECDEHVCVVSDLVKDIEEDGYGEVTLFTLFRSQTDEISEEDRNGPEKAKGFILDKVQLDPNSASDAVSRISARKLEAEGWTVSYHRDRLGQDTMLWKDPDGDIMFEAVDQHWPKGMKKGPWHVNLDG